MGIVYLAQEKSVGGREVALKVFKPEFLQESMARARFRREVTAMAKMSHHPGFLTVYSVDEISSPVPLKGLLYIAMEYLDGKELAVINWGRRQVGKFMEQFRVAYIFREICLALAHAHGKDVIHRDLKPENVMVVSGAKGRDVVKLLDFGIVKMPVEVVLGPGEEQTELAKRLTTAGMVCGTPQYMSPEQARGDAGIDGRSDLYALGVMLYECLSGEMPFTVDSSTSAQLETHEVAMAMLIQRFDPEIVKGLDPRKHNSDADPELSALALKLMQIKPEDRVQTAEEVAEQLEQISLRLQVARTSSRGAAAMVSGPLVETPSPSPSVSIIAPGQIVSGRGETAQALTPNSPTTKTPSASPTVLVDATPASSPTMAHMLSAGVGPVARNKRLIGLFAVAVVALLLVVVFLVQRPEDDTLQMGDSATSLTQAAPESAVPIQEEQSEPAPETVEAPAPVPEVVQQPMRTPRRDGEVMNPPRRVRAPLSLEFDSWRTPRRDGQYQLAERFARRAQSKLKPQLTQAQQAQRLRKQGYAYLRRHNKPAACRAFKRYLSFLPRKERSTARTFVLADSGCTNL